jgi:hypothetical protein
VCTVSQIFSHCRTEASLDQKNNTQVAGDKVFPDKLGIDGWYYEGVMVAALLIWLG